MAYTYPLLIPLGAGYTGLGASLRYRIRDAAQIDVVAATSSGITELGASGNYWVLNGVSLPDNFTIGYAEVSVDSGSTWLFCALVGPLDMPVPQQQAIATQTAALVLVTPAQKLATDSAGRVTVGSIAAGAITAAAIATGAVDADALATDAVTEIATGVDTALTLSHGSGMWDGTGAAAPDECNIYVTVRGNGQWQQNVRVTCESASPPDVVDGAVIYSARETLRTGSDGKVTFTRPRGISVRVTVPDSAADVTLTVPDAASYNIALSI